MDSGQTKRAIRILRLESDELPGADELEVNELKAELFERLAKECENQHDSERALKYYKLYISQKEKLQAAKKRRAINELKRHLLREDTVIASPEEGDSSEEDLRKIKEMNRELLRLDEEKNDFISVVVHDLKNPLSAIQMMAGILKNEKDLSPEEIEHFADHILDVTKRMFELITNLLDINRIQSGRVEIHPEEFDFTTLLTALVEEFGEQAKAKNISLHFEEVDQEITLYSDWSIVLEVLENLLSNAIKYSPHGKRVFVRAAIHEANVYCEVRDEGPGLSEEDQKNLFGKFSRLTPQPTGGESSSGLGLFITRKLVNLLGGDIDCTSTLGIGTTFSVQIPLRYEEKA